MTIQSNQNNIETLSLLGYEVNYDISLLSLNELPLNSEKLVVNTINPHCYCVAKQDPVYRKALQESDILIPDGIGIVWAAKFLAGKRIKRITGADLHNNLLNQLNASQGKAFYLGSAPSTLTKIENKVKKEFPAVTVGCYSPPYKPVFTDDENATMVNAVKEFHPDVVFLGMTAPKQEKWVWQHKEQINTKIIASIGAAFDFYAGTARRAPNWMQHTGLEWLHRSISNPKKLGKRNLFSNVNFLSDVIKFKFGVKK